MDEKLVIWGSIVNTMQNKMRSPEEGKGVSVSKTGFLEIHDDNANEVLKLEFHGMMLESIDDMLFTTTTEDDIITLGVSMRYDYYTIVGSKT
jgi:hypothetical protein